MLSSPFLLFLLLPPPQTTLYPFGIKGKGEKKERDAAYIYLFSLSLSLYLFFSISHYLLPLFLFFYILQEAERNFGQDPSFWFSIKHKDGGSNAGNHTNRVSNAPYTSETLFLFSQIHCHPFFDYHHSPTLSIAPPPPHTKSHPSTSLSLSTQFTFCIFS